MADLTPETLADLRRVAVLARDADTHREWMDAESHFRKVFTPSFAVALLDALAKSEAERDRFKHLQSLAAQESQKNANGGRPVSHVREHGTSWPVTNLPCPDCGQFLLMGYLFLNEKREHMHTKYVCTFWPSGTQHDGSLQPKKPCGWSGYSVPGWNRANDRTEGDDRG